MPIKVQPSRHDDEPVSNLLVRVASGPVRAQDFALEQRVHTGLRPLAGTADAEDWISSAQVVRGCDATFRYAHNGEVCFSWLYFSADDSVEATARTAYAKAFRVFEDLGFAHLLRVWHYLPDIHSQEAGASRYRRFCRGRFAAFEAAGRQDYCAATVIGTRASFGVMYFLAARAPGVAVENPRQTSAWRYPSAALEERPLFARAVCKAWGGTTHFYASGTAGIVGHESQHLGDTAAQLREALVNLRALLDETSDFAGVERLSCLKAYLAHAGDADTVRGVLETSAFKFDSIALFEGEICRPELRVEIEALIV